jgi:Protein of unknown function (DUF2917)
MNRNLEIFDADVTLCLDDAPLPLRLPAGAAIFALRGSAWITQERLRDDIVLTRGQRFDVKGTELILASAIKGSATIHVVPPAEARVNGAREVHDFLRAQAGRMRAEEVRSFANHLGSSIAVWLVRARGLLTARPRALGH